VERDQVQYHVSQNWYDLRNRLVASKEGAEAGTESTRFNWQRVYREYDNLNEVSGTEQYNADGVTLSDSKVNVDSNRVR